MKCYCALKSNQSVLQQANISRITRQMLAFETKAAAAVAKQTVKQSEMFYLWAFHGRGVECVICVVEARQTMRQSLASVTVVVVVVVVAGVVVFILSVNCQANEHL